MSQKLGHHSYIHALHDQDLKLENISWKQSTVHIPQLEGVHIPLFSHLFQVVIFE